MIKNCLRRNWPLIIIFLLGLVPFVWFRPGMIIAGGDNSVYLDPSINLYNNYFAWFDKIDAGMPSLERPKLFPFSFFWQVNKEIGLSLPNIERIWIVLHFVLPGLFMYLLVKFLYRSQDRKGQIAGLISAVLYMFNYLVIVDAFQPALRPVLTFLPLMMFFWIKGLFEKKFSLKYSLLIALTSLLYGSANINFASVSPIYLILAVYFLFFLVSTRRFKHGLIFLFCTVFFLFFFNIWWLTNFYFSSIQIDKGIIEVVRSYDFLKSTPINEAFRTMGFWAFLQQFNGKVLLPFALSYYRFPLIFITFFIPILAFSSLIFKTNVKEKLFFVFLALLGVFLAKGSNRPFGFIYQFLYDKVPGFSMYREPFAKFTLISVFAFSVLLGFSIEDLYFFLKLNKKKVVWKDFLPFGTVLIILICWYPLILGEHIQDEEWYSDSRMSLYVKVPDYWHEAGEWFEENGKNSKVILFPKTFYGQTYNWESGISSGDPIAMHFLKNPLIRFPNYGVTPQNRLAQILYKVLYLRKAADLTAYLDLFAVNYVLQQNDISWNNEGGIFDPFVMAEILENQKNLKPVAAFGQLEGDSTQGGKQNQPVGKINTLDVFSVVRNYPSLQIYRPKRIIYIQGKLESYPDFFSFYQYNPGDSYLFLEEKENRNLKIIEDENSLFSINLKEKHEKRNNDFVFNFELPIEGNYSLFVNEYLFNPEFSKLGSEFKIVLNDKPLNIPSETLGRWRNIDFGVLKKGQHFLSTNFPVEEIKEDYLTSPFWVVENKSFSRENLNFAADSQPHFTKVNPSKYRVEVRRSKFPYYWLVLSETFNPEWKIYYKNKKIDAGHFLLNGYANGWFIKEADVEARSDYTLELRYEPQKYADYGTIISSVFVIGAVFYLVFGWFKEKKHKGEKCQEICL